MIAQLTLVCLSLLQQDAGNEFDRLESEYQAALAAWEAKFDVSRREDVGTAEGPEWFIARYRAYPVWDFAPRFLDCAEHPADGTTAARALEWIIDHGNALAGQ